MDEVHQSPTWVNKSRCPKAQKYTDWWRLGQEPVMVGEIYVR